MDSVTDQQLLKEVRDLLSLLHGQTKDVLTELAKRYERIIHLPLLTWAGDKGYNSSGEECYILNYTKDMKPLNISVSFCGQSVGVFSTIYSVPPFESVKKAKELCEQHYRNYLKERSV